MRKKFNENDFHDCFLITVDFSHWQEEVSLTFWCPKSGEEWEEGRYLQVSFQRILFFGFELAVIGELGSSPPMISNIVLQQNSKYATAWGNRIAEVAKPSRHYPKGIKSPTYSEVYHFSLDSVEFRRQVFFLEDDSFQIICRDFHVQDVTTKVQNKFNRYDPATIDSE